MASGDSDRDAEAALSKLLQIATVAEYQIEFEMLINRVTRISESLLKTFYISGLKPALQCALLRSNPTTLGEAFFKARITEARFKDERSTIAIAKANNLNTGVHVQDLDDEPNVLKGNRVIGVGENENNKGDDKEVQYSVYTLHVLIPLLKRLNDKYIKKKKMEAAIQRRLWNPGIKSVFQDNTLRARLF
ncbi:hypothetical protein Tco_1394516 [Tanacetum coccineum]